jgi:hypothetical protein
MNAHRIETTLDRDGTLTLTDLPFHAGGSVEVIILARSPKPLRQNRYPLRGKPIKYEHPTDPVAQDEKCK